MIGRSASRLAPLLLLLLAAGQGTANPVAIGADPHVTIVGQDYWMYPTGSPDPADKGRALFYAYRSPDLQRWTRVGPILEMESIDWVDDDGAPRHHLWAPALVEANGRYYFYYSVGPQNPTPSRIGVAVGDSPAGPFEDSGKPLLSGGDGFEAIDPMVFVDPRSGDAYLYAGGSAGATLRVFKLKPNMMEIEREIPVDQPPHFTEGAFMHERDGIYYLSYSEGRWNDASYSVHYATGPSPAGPWRYRGRILESSGEHKGPGHHAIVGVPGSAVDYIVYHRWNDAAGDGPFRGHRKIAIERLFYGPEGRIEPVTMTDALPPAHPIVTRR